MYKIDNVIVGRKGRFFKKWIFHAGSPLMSQAAIGDINNDNLPEIVFGTKNGDIFCVDAKGRELWTFKTYNKQKVEKNTAVESSPVIIDINHDGKEEIIFGTESGMLFCLSNKGKLLWRYQLEGGIKASPKVEDINHDGYLEILVPCIDRKLYIISYSGKILNSFTADSPLESTPCIIKGKDTRIIVGSIRGTIYSLDSGCNIKWRLKTEEGVKAEPSYFFYNEELIVFGTLDGNLFLLDRKGNILWKYKTHGAIYSKPIIKDINEDSIPEIVFGSGDSRIYALTIYGEKLWSYETHDKITANVVVEDFDNDGKIEIMAGSHDSNIYILEGKEYYKPNYIPGLSSAILQGTHLSEFLVEEPVHISVKKITEFSTDGIVVGCSLMHEGREKNIIVNVRSGFVDEFVFLSRK